MAKYIFTDVVEVTEVSVENETQYRITYSDGRVQRIDKDALDAKFFPLETGEQITQNDIERFIEKFSVVRLNDKTFLASAFLKNQETIYALTPVSEGATKNDAEIDGKQLISVHVRSLLDGLLKWGTNGISPDPEEPSDNEKAE